MIEAVQARIERNAKQILTDAEVRELEEPYTVHEFYVETDDGPVTAVRTQHRMGYDGSGGGFKIVEVGADMPPEEMLRLNQIHSLGLGTLMTLKGGLATLELPGRIGEEVGGAKGEMYVPSGTLASRNKMDTILTDYVLTQADKGVIGVGIDRHAPDMNSGAPEMDHMARVLTRYTEDETAIAAFSGKSIEAGGLEGREIATAQGLVYILEKHLDTLGLDPKKTTVAVQGAGNVGYHFARLASEQLGVKIVGISDKHIAVVASPEEPLRIDETITFADRQIATWNDGLHTTLTSPDDLLDLSVDVFVFAAAPDVITKEKGNKHRLKARIILPGANNPMDGDAIDYYIQNGVSVLSDIESNLGGFVTSNMEYNQGVTGIDWTEAMVLQALKKVVDDSYDKVLEEAAGNPYNMVDPAFRVAIKSQYEKDRRGLYAPAH